MSKQTKARSELADWAEQLKNTFGYKLPNEDPDKALTVGICHYLKALEHHPKGTTMEAYMAHWLEAQEHRADLYSPEQIDRLVKIFGKPKPIQGLSLKKGYSYVWERIETDDQNNN
jgi:hypothetical protein